MLSARTMTACASGTTISAVTISRLGTGMANAPTTWAAASADGRLEIFVVGVDDTGGQALWQISETAPGEGWSQWLSHGVPPDSAGLRWSPAVAAAADGRLEVFIVSDDLQPGGLGSGGPLYRRTQDAPGHGWADWVCHEPDGPDLFGSPAVAGCADGGLELFALGTDGALWHSRQTDTGAGWSQWFSHGNPAGLSLNSAPAVAASADGHLEVFIVSQEAELWRIRQTAPNGGWSPWFAHGTPSDVSFGSDSTPGLAADADGCLHLFTVGNDGRVWHMRQTAPDGDWSGWRSHDATSGLKFQRLRPAVARAADGRLEVFVVGNDENLWHMRQSTPGGDWSSWSCREAPPPAGILGCPAVAAGAEGRLGLFVAGTDGALWHMWQIAPGGDWSPWASRGTPPRFVLLGALTTG